MFKFLKTIFAALGLLSCTAPTHAQWQSTPLPCRPNVQNLQFWQDKVYASTEGQNVFASADNGMTWQRVFRAPGFSINPHNGRFYRFSGSHNANIEFSDDAGLSWQWLAYRPTLWYDYTTMRFSGDTLLLFDPGGLWRVIGQPGQKIPIPTGFSIQRCLVFGKNIWLSNGESVMHSPDAGVVWDTVFAPQPGISYAMTATHDTLLISAWDQPSAQTTLHRSIDQGKNWTTAALPFPSYDLSGGNPFFATEIGMNQAWISWNGLDDWQPTGFPLQQGIMKVYSGQKMAGQRGGLFLETGGQWRPVVFGEGIAGEPMYAALKITPKHLLFGRETWGYGLAKKPLGGAWVMSDKPYFAERPARIGNALIGAGNYGTYRADLDATDFDWQLLHPEGGSLYAMNGALYRCDVNNGLIFKSSDAGQTWTQTGQLPANFEYTGNGLTSILDADGGRFYLRDGKTLLVSEDEGATWALRYAFTQFNPNVSGNIGRIFTVGGHVFLSNADKQEIYVSDDNGVTFSTLSAPKNTNPIGVFRLRIYENTLYLYNGDGNLYRSGDWGQTWSKVKPPYREFDFDAATALSNSTGNDTTLCLFDPARGLAWTANPNDLVRTPCDDIKIDMGPTHCWRESFYVNVTGAISGLKYSYFKNGSLVQQYTDFVYPLFQTEEGEQVVLEVFDPNSGCALLDTTVRSHLPVADFGQPNSLVLPCEMQFDTLDLSGGSVHPYIFQEIYEAPNFSTWTRVFENDIYPNGQPSQPAPPTLHEGTYILRVTDRSTGCYAHDTLMIQRPIGPTTIDYEYVPATCGQNDGILGLQTGAWPGTTYQWSTGGTGASISGLAPGWYSITATNGFCRETRNMELPENPACKARLRGTVWNDAASPGCTAAAPQKGVLLHLLPDDLYTFTDQQGNYEFARAPGNCTVGFVDTLHFDLLCPASGSISVNLPTFGAVSSGHDFFVAPKPVKNLALSLNTSVAVPGFPLQFYMNLCNYGDSDAAASVVFHYDAALTASLGDLGSQFESFDTAGHTAFSYVHNFAAASGCLDFPFQMTVPADLPIGTVLHFSADAVPTAGDFFPADNHVEWSQTVVGSFDPNDKSVSSGETEFGGRIFEKDSLLTYTVRFQNTGNYPATTVEIRDTLDPSLDVQSIQLAQTSHPQQLELRFEGYNILIFRFTNIQLPDSMTSQDMSQGFVSFSIKRKPGLPVGTVIRNRAGIYFDFNAPVMTNWVESVLSPPVGVEPEPKPGFAILIFPNPNTGRFTVELPAPANLGMHFRITDLTGRVLQERHTETGSARQFVQAGSLPNGLYFLQVVSEGKVLAVGKFVKQ